MTTCLALDDRSFASYVDEVARVELLDSGHFALEEDAARVADLIKQTFRPLFCALPLVAHAAWERPWSLI